MGKVNLRRTYQLSQDERKLILQEFFSKMIRRDRPKLIHGSINEISAKFHLSRVSISKFWKNVSHQIQEGKIVDPSSNKKNCGRKEKDYDVKLKNIKNIPLNRRSNIRSLACASEIPRSTLFRKLKEEKGIKRVTTTLKPTLTEKNRMDRLKFCLSFVKSNGYFQDFYNYVHIDEKWFYLSQNKRTYYLTMEEEEPYRTCKSKRFITKVMFMAAVARPRGDVGSEGYFDGKIGIWPFVYQEEAKRNSKNRQKGTLLTKNIESINAPEYKKMVLENVFPAIRAKFPQAHNVIYVQQDNAKPHFKENDPDVLRDGAGDEVNILFKNQPPNSPDLNVLDLGFFNAIQSVQHQHSPKNIDDFISCVNKAFEELHPDKLDYVF